MQAMTKDEAEIAIDRIREGIGASYWLKNALKTSLSRDCVDALHDAQTLVMILRARVSY